MGAPNWDPGPDSTALGILEELAASDRPLRASNLRARVGDDDIDGPLESLLLFDAVTVTDDADPLVSITDRGRDAIDEGQ